LYTVDFNSLDLLKYMYWRDILKLSNYITIQNIFLI